MKIPGAVRIVPWLDQTLQGVRYAARGLRRTPAIPVAMILTIALAVGINLAMVGLIDRALLSPPAHVVDPGRVFTIAFETTGPAADKGLIATTSFLSFEAIRTGVPDVTARRGVQLGRAPSSGTGSVRRT